MKGTPSPKTAPGALRASWAPGLVAVCGRCLRALTRVNFGWYCNATDCTSWGHMAPAFSLPENVRGCTLPGPL